MAEFDVRAYLSTKGLHGRQANGFEVVYPCWMDCHEPSNSARTPKMYVNVADGWFNCKRCGSSGGTYLMMQSFGDDPREHKEDLGPDPLVRRRILTAATDVAQEMLDQNDKLLLWLMDERGLTYETITKFKLGYAGNGWSLSKSLPGESSREDLKTTGLIYRDGLREGQDFYYDHLLIPYRTRGSTVQIRGRQNPLGDGKGGKYLTGPGDDCYLFNQDALDGAEDVIIVEGELDCMALSATLERAPGERLRKTAVVALAGVDAHPVNFLDYFTGAKRVYIGFDSDEAGMRAAHKLKDLFGAQGRIIKLPADPGGKKVDWSEWLLPDKPDASDYWRASHPHRGHDWKDVSALIASASGRRLFSVAEVGVSYRTSKLENPEGLKTGYKQLDDAIMPGLLPGQVMIVLAKTGTGKSLLLCNLAYQMRDSNVLFISMEMTKEEIYERLYKLYLFHHPAASDDDLETAYAKVLVCDENRLNERDFELLLAEYEVETGERPHICFVDYLGYYARGAKGNSPYEKVSTAVMQLKEEAKKGRFAIIAPAQVNRGAKEGKPIDLDDARESGVVEETADFLLSIYRPDDALIGESSQATWMVRLAILKSRHGGKGTVISLQMDPLTLAIVDAGTSAALRAEGHVQQHHRGYTYDDIRNSELAEARRGEQRPFVEMTLVN